MEQNMQYIYQVYQDGSFTKAAEKFLKENPRYAGKGVYRAVMSTETETNGAGGSMNDSINDAIRAAARR